MENRISKVILTTCLTVLIGLTGFSGSVMAVTPDGSTPANEGVCDSLTTASKGLYGLCVAYCEAQDLDSVTNKKTPNSKILENYRKKMQAGDPDMPCVQTPCPCWSAEELASITSDGAAAVCLRNTASTIEIIDDTTSAPALRKASADTGNNSCIYIDLNVPRFTGQAVTAEEAQGCYSTVSQACDSLGL